MEGCALGSGPSTLCSGGILAFEPGWGGLNTLLSRGILALERGGGSLNTLLNLQTCTLNLGAKGMQKGKKA